MSLLKYSSIFLQFCFMSSLVVGCSVKKSSSSGTESTVNQPFVVPETTTYVFSSIGASNLIDGSSSKVWQVFQKNVVTGELKLVSKNAEGVMSDSGSLLPSQSADGTKVVFNSCSGNLMEGVSGCQVYYKNMVTGEVKLVSSTSGGVANIGQSDNFALKISGDGNRVAFLIKSTNLTNESDGTWGIYAKDMTTGKIIRVDTSSSGIVADRATNTNPNSYDPNLSYDGKKIIFMSDSSNLVDVGVDENNDSDIFVKDFDTGETKLVSAAADGTVGNIGSNSSSISGDGKRAAFSSGANNLIANDTDPLRSYLFMKNLETGEVTKFRTGNSGSFFPSLNYDGTKMAFVSWSSNLFESINGSGPDLMILDVPQLMITLATPNNNSSSDLSAITMAQDGKSVVFQTQASLIADDPGTGNDSADWDVYLFKMDTAGLSRINTNSFGVISDSGCKIDPNW